METDDEQVEKLKKWWQENGRSVVAGVIIGVGGLFGYRYWIDYQNDQAEQASQHFDQMVEAMDASQNDKAIGYAENLLADFSSTDYAIMARFALARIYVENGDFDKAGEQLQHAGGLFRFGCERQRLLFERIFQRLEMLLVGVAVCFVKFNKHDAAGAKVVGHWLRTDDLTVDLNEVVVEPESDAQLLS